MDLWVAFNTENHFFCEALLGGFYGPGLLQFLMELSDHLVLGLQGFFSLPFSSQILAWTRVILNLQPWFNVWFSHPFFLPFISFILGVTAWVTHMWHICISRLLPGLISASIPHVYDVMLPQYMLVSPKLIFLFLLHLLYLLSPFPALYPSA